jgi:hypothetical protein
MLAREVQISKMSGTIRTLPWIEAFASHLAQEAQEVSFLKDDEIYAHEEWAILLKRISSLEQVDLLTFVKPPVLASGDAIVFPVCEGRVGPGEVVQAEAKWSPLRGSLFYGNDRTYGHFHA